jgi:hypothetical protein
VAQEGDILVPCDVFPVCVAHQEIHRLVQIGRASCRERVS